MLNLEGGDGEQVQGLEDGGRQVLDLENGDGKLVWGLEDGQRVGGALFCAAELLAKGEGGEGDLLEGGEVPAGEGEHPNNGVIGRHASVSHLPCCSIRAGCRPGVRSSNPGQGDRFTPQSYRT